MSNSCPELRIFFSLLGITWYFLHVHFLQAEPASKPTPTDAAPKRGRPSAAETSLEISLGEGDEKPKPVKKKRAAKKTTDDEEIWEKSSEKEGGSDGDGGDDSTLLDFSFGDDVAAKPRKKRPVLSSTKNPPKRRLKKPGEEDGGEGEENSIPAQKVWLQYHHGECNPQELYTVEK